MMILCRTMKKWNSSFCEAEMKRVVVSSLLFLSTLLAASAQTGEVRDTLRRSVVVGEKSRTSEAGSRIIKVKDFRDMVSATGESDVIKFIQTLPGVRPEGRALPLFMSEAVISVATS